MAESSENVHEKIAKNQVKIVGTGETVALESLWQEKTCVIKFLRRFGCMLCRMGAQQLSLIKPTLDAHDIRLVGIGLEELGVDEFVAGNFFAGDLFIDLTKQNYKDLEYKRFNMLSIIPALFTKESRDAISKGRQDGVPGNMKGDGLQMGGTMIIAAGGERTLAFWKQENPSEHVDPKLILEKLGISE